MSCLVKDVLQLCLFDPFPASNRYLALAFPSFQVVINTFIADTHPTPTL